MRAVIAVAVAVIAVMAVALFLYLSGPSGYAVSGEALAHPRETYLVTRVVDGDTVVLESGESVRLLGIDTPERGQECYKEATERLKELILKKDVDVERDIEDKDRYKRSLRYIFLNGTFVNELLVREGYAYLYFIEPNSRYNDALKEAAQAAKAGKTGCLWNQSA
ncbi:MAG: thermonuclease family protein [Candidatus Aenigmarchaeota archaeon]|nr:thermonuclease family protein [Candidatus Aenigmarchaeota archaeon]